MQFRVLGPLVVSDGDRVVDLGRPKQRAVLAVLALHANTFVSRDTIVGLVWGDTPPQWPDKSVRASVSKLRRALEPNRMAGEAHEVLQSRPSGYLLRIGPDDLDASRFEALAGEGRRLLASGRPGEALEALRAALATWRGDVLADLGSQPLAWPRAADLQDLRLAAVEDRVQAELAVGHHASVADEVAGLVARFPARERLWRLLMLALYRCGRQTDALRAFAEACDALSRQPGVTPSPDLARLEAAILRRSPNLAWHASAQAGTEAAPVQVGTGDSSEAWAPGDATRAFVGRTEELADLEAALDCACAGQGRIVLVSGEPGIGKTRLVEELADRASARGLGVAWGRARDGNGAPPLSMWVDVLRAAVGLAEPHTLARAVGPGASWLAQLVPDAAQALGSPGLPPALEAESARLSLYQAVVAALAAAAARRPLVVVLDDLHWADVASLGLCELLASGLRSARVLVVGTFRPGELAPDHPLVATLGVLARQPRLERVPLDGLSHDEVVRFVAGMGHAGPSDDVAEALHARTDGNPLFLAELVTLLAGEGKLGQADAVMAAAVPANVQEVLRRRLRRLPQSTNELLEVASVVGRDFDLGVLAAATDHGEPQAMAAVEPAVATGMVAEDSNEVGRYRFTHSLVQETLYGGLTTDGRARLHARVGATIEGLPRDAARVTELAQHFYRAAGEVGPERGVAYALEAADAAQARLAFEAVETLLRRALVLVDCMPAGPERDRQELVVQNKLGLSLMMNGGFNSPAAERACDRAAELALGLGDTRELLSSMAGLAKSAVVHAEWEVVTSLGSRMVDLGEASGDTIGVSAGLYILGNASMFRGRLELAHQRVTEAIALSHPLWEQRPQAASLWVSPLVYALAVDAVVLSLMGEEQRASAAAAEAVHLARTGGYPFWLAGVQLCNAIRHACAGRVVDAAGEAELSVALGRSANLTQIVAMGQSVKSWAAARANPRPAELAQMRSALRACDAAGVRMWGPLYQMLLADVCQLAGRPEEALSAADAGLERINAVGERVCEAELHRIRGEALAAMGPGYVAGAVTSMRRAVAVADEQGAAVFLRRALDSLERLGTPAPN